MKGFAMAALGCLSLHAAAAQTPAPPEPSTDSSRYIPLDEIRLTSHAAGPQRRMLDFYRRNPNMTLEEILSRLPEMSFQRRGPYGMEPGIRGFSGGQINVLIDGMRVYGACTDRMDPPTIYVEPANLDNIKLQTAQAGTLHGSSVGGSVLLQTAEPSHAEDGRLHVMLGSGYSSASRGWYESVRMHYGKGRWSLLANASLRKNRDYRSGGGTTVPFSGLEKSNHNLSVAYRLNEALVLKADYIGDDGRRIGYPALPMDVGHAAARIGSLSVRSRKATRTWSEWNAKLYANGVRHHMDDTRRPNVPIHMDMPGKSRTLGAFFEGTRKAGRRGTLQTRADASSSLFKASMTMYPPGEKPMYMLTWPDHRKIQAGAGASWRHAADSNWSLLATARIDMVRYALTSEEAKESVAILGYGTDGRSDALKNLSATVNRKLSPRASVHLTVGYSERAPTGSELYGFYLFNAQDGYDHLGNSSLGREAALQAEAGLRGRWQPGGRGTGSISYAVNAFATRLEGYIAGVVEPGLSPMTIGANGVKSYRNLSDAAWQAGGEASLSGRLGGIWHTAASLRYTHARDGKGRPLPFVPPLKTIASLGVQPGRFSAQAEWEAAAAQERYSVPAGEDRTAGYSLLHLRLGYRLNAWKTPVAFTAGVDNILDARYYEHLDWGNIPRPGRNLFAQIKVSL